MRLKMRMSSRKHSTILSSTSRNVSFISCMKVPGALHRPIGSTVYSKWPKRVRNAVFSRSSGRMANLMEAIAQIDLT